MERELTLATLTLSACGTSLLAAGALLPKATRPDAGGRSGRALEGLCARRVWAPAFVALVAFALLLGWGLQEPDITGEAIGPVVRVLAVAFAVVWSRALLRAGLSLVAASRSHPTAARTVGLLRPRVVVPPQLAAHLDASELQAAVAHERAHARHRDPLRLWLAQLVTDLQWPVPVARGHLRAWRSALELARDEEAREAGADGADLASAILKAARLEIDQQQTTAAALVDTPQLADRVARLLAPPIEAGGQPRARWAPALLAAAVVAGVLVGLVFGEPVVRALP